MFDAFGVDVAEGDYVLSAASSTSRAKLGYVTRAKNGALVMTVEREAQYGKECKPSFRTGPFGASVLVLRKADGTVPAHLTGGRNGA